MWPTDGPLNSSIPYTLEALCNALYKFKTYLLTCLLTLKIQTLTDVAAADLTQDHITSEMHILSSMHSLWTAAWKPLSCTVYNV